MVRLDALGLWEAVALLWPDVALFVGVCGGPGRGGGTRGGRRREEMGRGKTRKGGDGDRKKSRRGMTKGKRD